MNFRQLIRTVFFCVKKCSKIKIDINLKFIQLLTIKYKDTVDIIKIIFLVVQRSIG